jgi:hypothetical protein
VGLINLNDLARLVAIEDIKQLKARYYRVLDTHDWEGFRSLWTPDAIMDMNFPDRILTSEDGIYRGPDAITAFAIKAVGAATSIDHALMPEIEILTATTARAIWAQEDRVFWPEGYPNKSLHGFGYEHETYEMIDGKWRIKSTKLVRVKTDIERNAPRG